MTKEDSEPFDTTQDKQVIREGIVKEIEATLIVCGQNPLTAKALAMDTSLSIVNNLHDNGVVIKVDRKIEGCGCEMCLEDSGVSRCLVEPLI